MPGRFITGDRDDPGFVRELMALKPDFWFDLALFEPMRMEDLIAAWDSAGRPVKLFTVAGSIAEYGFAKPLTIPVHEGAPLDGEGAYSRGKAEAWLVGYRAWRKSRFPICWAVLPQLWGPGDRHGRDAWYVQHILADKPICLRGDGRTLMPDGYAGTAAEAMVHLGFDDLQNAGIRANVAGTAPLTPLSFVRWAAHALEREVEIRHLPQSSVAKAQQTAGRQFRPVFGDYDYLLAMEILEQTGFRQTISAMEGVRLTAQWHRDNPGFLAPDFDPAPDFLVGLPQ